MTIFSFFTSLFSLGLTWIAKALYTAALFMDGIIYTIVSYCYTIFIIMCNINYNSLMGIVASLLKNIEAMVMVFVVFKLGITLIQYLLEPEKAAKEGSKIIINLFITAALLISYGYIFGVFNELGMLLIGNPTGYDYVYLNSLAGVTSEKDEGLIMRLVLGETEVEDIGDYLAYSTVTIFIHDYGNPQSSRHVAAAICRKKDEKCQYTKLVDLVTKIDLDVEYMPVVGFVVGLYLAFTLIKTAIQVGIRMFKLLILQILAPVAIITIIGDGLKSEMFQNFVKKYISVFLEVFIRMFSMLIVSVFVCKFFVNIGDFFMALKTDDTWTTLLVTVLVIVAAFKFASDIPKFINDILPGKFKVGEEKGGFGKFLGGLMGAGLGAVTGFVGGFAGGGLGGAVAGLGAGIFKGGSAGAKGNNIADFFKGQGKVAGDAKSRGQNIRARGGLGNVMLGGIQSGVGLGDFYDRRISALDRQTAALNAYDTGSAAELKERKVKASGSQLSTYGFAGGGDVTMSSKDEYKAKMREYHSGYNDAAAKLKIAEQSGDESAISAARLELAKQTKIADDAAGNIYEEARAALAADETSHTHTLAANYKALANKNAHIHTRSSDGRSAESNTLGATDTIDIKDQQRMLSNRKYGIQDRAGYDRTHGQKPGGN